MEPYTPNPFDYSLLGWLYATASKDEKLALQRGLAAKSEATNFYTKYNQPGFDFNEAPAEVGQIFNDVLQPDNAQQWRAWHHPEADILQCHPEAHVWVLSRSTQHHQNQKLRVDAQEAA